MMFIDITKAFDLVSRKGLFELLSIMISFHTNIKRTVFCDGYSLDSLCINSDVKHHCVLASTLFRIFFSLLLSYAFDLSTDNVLLHGDMLGSCYDGNLAHLCSEIKGRMVLRDMLFADGAALVMHTEAALQRMANQYLKALRPASSSG